MRRFFLAAPLLRRARVAALVALAVPAVLPAQAIGVGVGFGVGTRTGLTVSIGAQVTDAVQLVCKGGGLPFLPSSLSCGTHLYVLDDEDRFVVAEVGMLAPPPPYDRGPRQETRWVFVQGGLGVRDHELPDDDDDGLPEYPRWINLSWSGGVSLVVARIRTDVIQSAEGDFTRERHARPALWPLFFADGQMEIYLPGRDCAKCGGRPESIP
ncbi:MAG TPA: hypothetical protein VHG93_17000 [Longimicrobium sp.]|nr:hypothetical protein [Longimicrobium sp.]